MTGRGGNFWRKSDLHEIQLSGDLQSGQTRTRLRDEKLDIPTTIAPFNRFVYVSTRASACRMTRTTT